MIPEFNRRFVCIFSGNNPILSGIALSYIQQKNHYTPTFLFPNVEKKLQQVDELDRYYMMITRANETAVRISNAILAMGGCDYLILVGLDDNQKSYLKYLSNYKVIDVQDVADADTFLSGLVEKSGYVSCSEKDLYHGLYSACDTNCILKIDNEAPAIVIKPEGKTGIVIIEDHRDSSVIIAINYSLSVNTELVIIDPPNISRPGILDYIENWKSTGDQTFFYNLSALVYPSIAAIDFSKYEFATFFTFGFPYSLVLENIIPITHVNIDLHADFFIFNNIYFEKFNAIFSAIVFSPRKFKMDEETTFVIHKLKSENFFVKELVGVEATSFNIDRHVAEFPFNVLHICSHGGQVNGYEVKVEFKDIRGVEHLIEYDEVVSFAPELGKEDVLVTSKMLFRKLDGYYWRSKELKALNFPSDVYDAMNKAIHDFGEKKRKVKEVIPGSCAIICVDFHYQAMFNSIAGWHTNPFIFNNTCWSWSEISQSFLSVGSRGYIGTLWGVNNDVAKEVAQTFYDNVFDSTILSALRKSLVHTEGTTDYNIYAFWGLHFSTIKKGASEEESRMKVADKLLLSFYRWREHLKGVKNKKTEENINRLIDWNCDQLKKHFKLEALKLLVQKRLRHK